MLGFYSSDSGRLYTFGSNDWGQLGHGNTKPYTKPSVVKSEYADETEDNIFFIVQTNSTLTIFLTEVLMFNINIRYTAL